jgi:arylsulfatase A-like enzyme
MIKMTKAALVTGLTGLILLNSCGFNEDRPPNIIIMLVDDLGWADTGVYGSTYYETPNIDRLAGQGMRFTNGYAACAVCSPTRAAVMTGRYPARLGVTDWIRARFQGGEIPADRQNPTGYEGGPENRLLCPENALWMESREITIAELLRDAGYATCHIGKWHLGAEEWYPEKQGFDYNFGGCDYGQPPSYFDPYTNERLTEGIYHLPSREPGEHLTDREADEAVNFIRQHRSQPFFLYFANYAVHTPVQGRPDLVEKYKAKTPTHQTDPEYAALVEGVDIAVGKIMRSLEELDLADKTIIIFTSDNGGLLSKTSNAPLRSGKGFPYEGGIREPVIVRWPGNVEPGSVCDIPISSIDYLPTVCEIAGVETPPDRPIDGVSITALLKQTGTIERDALFWHFPHYRYDQETPYSIVRAGDWKLLKRYEGPSFELFNLALDLSEKQDLSEQFPEKVQALDALLSRWLQATGAKIPRPNSDFRG